ncbi:hypothetical protein JHK84_052865 [Glycine max]|nr:hypothetical protein JHK85_053693 [Glycine max]KAG5082827.1 hypothetical protein JHK84_052865 [Glycine max]
MASLTAGFHRHNNHRSHSSSASKIIIFFCLSAFLGLAIIANLFRASLSTHYLSIATNWVDTNAPVLILKLAATPHNSNNKGKDGKIAQRMGPQRFLSATFADLPAPEWQWEQMPSAPVPRLDGYSIQIKNTFYVFAGYAHLDHVHSHIDVFDFSINKWVDQIKMPNEMAHSHLGIASDGSGPTTASFSLDTATKKWKPLPPLPAPRYAPATQLWKGRLHVMGGSKENRHTPGRDHWSLAVKDGETLEQQWRDEVPIPRGGPHRACIAVNDRLFVIGGQEGDFMAKPGSPIFKCSRRHEVVYGDVYMLDDEMKWKILPPMPKPDSHIECAWVIVNNSIIITGGTTEKHPVTKRMMLVGEVFQFHLDTMKWSVIGKLPYRIKTTLTGFWDGWLYFTSGQRDRGPDNPQPKKVVGETWRTKLHLS